MVKKRILLTGDDGYNSIGTRVLIHLLRNDFDLSIAGTKFQQSGVGGFASIKKGGTWGETQVDGISGIWVEGSPVDTIECAYAFFQKPFDCVISGINLGVNIGGYVYGSGTFAAAYRAIFMGITKRTIAISTDLTHEFHTKDHNGDEELSDYIQHFGHIADELIRKTFKNNYWGTSFVNINIPACKPRGIRFTRLNSLSHNFWSPVEIDKKHHTFMYPPKDWADTHVGPFYDQQAIADGYISITPCRTNMTDDGAYEKIKKRTIAYE